MTKLPVTNLQTGLRALVNRPHLLTAKYRDQQLRAERRGAAPELIAFERRFVGFMAKKHGVPLFAHNMVRTADEQTALFVQGVTKAQAGRSPHNFGCAVDIVHAVDAWDLAPESWTMLGHIGKELAHRMGVKLVWGGDWGDPDGDGPAVGWDPAHWELAYWRNVKSDYPWG